MTRTLIVAFFLACSTAVLPACAWWQKSAVPVLDCTAKDVASQVGSLITQLLAGNWAVLTAVGGDVLQCALASAESLPVNAPASSMGGPVGGLVDAPKRDGLVLAIKAEIARRVARK